MKLVLADLTYTQQGIQSEIMPQAIGCVGTYCRKVHGDRVDLRLAKLPEDFIGLLDGFRPDVVGFSNYAWNSRLAGRFAQAVKRATPSVKVVLGGPNYPVDPAEREAFLRQRPYADFYVRGEGEVAFAGLMGLLLDGAVDGSPIPGVDYIDPASGAYVSGPDVPRLTDLGEVPSPYLAGWLDPYFPQGFLPIVQTARGCPFSCTFCVEGDRYYSKVRHHQHARVEGELNYIGERMAPLVAAGRRADLFIADSNFGMFADDLETCRVLRGCQERHGWPAYISVATGKNNKDRVLEAAALVQGALRLSGSVQSLDQEVLDNVKRANVSSDQIVAIATEGGRLGANTYSEVILGLPGDTVEKFEATVAKLMEGGFNQVEVYTLMLLPGSEMNSAESRARFGLTTRFRLMPRCFGHFDYDGETLAVGEIEEVVVATNSMSFDEYVECRVTALFIAILHNDGLFSLTIELLKSLGIPFFRLVSAVRALALPPALAGVVREFRRETVDELWDDRDQLAAFIAQPENVKRGLDGEFGNNVLYRGKALTMTTAADDLAEVVAEGLKQVCAAYLGGLTDAQCAFIDEMTRYQGFRAKQMFDVAAPAPELETRFPFEEVVAAGGFATLGQAGVPVRYRFVHDDQQKRTIAWLVDTYGADVKGLSRLVTRANLKSLLRLPTIISEQ
jgi:radical SAM superfamily enzyme YgiQ (UPF0313 family)